MIVNDGKPALLNAQLAYLATLELGLYTSPVTVLPGTKIADLTEAAWAGYARVTLGAWSVPVLANNKARAMPVTVPTFTNASGAVVYWTGWFVVDPATGLLVSAVSVQQQAIPDGSSYPVRLVATDQDVMQ